MLVRTPERVMGGDFAGGGSSAGASRAGFGDQFRERWDEAYGLAFVGCGAQ